MARCCRWRARGWTSAAGCAALAVCAACSIDSRELDGPGETAGAGGANDVLGSAGASGNPSGPGAGAAGVSAAGTAASGAGGSVSASGAAGSAGASGASNAAGAAGAGGTGGTGGGDTGNAGAGNGACPGNLLVNGGFESGEDGWASFTTGSDPLIYDSTVPEYEGVEAHAGQRLGWLGGVPSETNRLSQAVSVPPETTRLALRYSLRVQIFEPHATIDFLRLRLVVGAEPVAVAELSNANAGDDWIDYAPEPLAISTDGQALPVTLEIESSIGAGPGTNFYVDDVALVPTCTQ